MPSFDIVSTFNIQEVDNAVNITSREPMWMITIHDKNVGNKISGNRLEHNEHLTTRFSIA